MYSLLPGHDSDDIGVHERPLLKRQHAMVYLMLLFLGVVWVTLSVVRGEKREVSPYCDPAVHKHVVLITGVNGLIGSAVAHELIQSRGCNYQIVGLVRPHSDLSLLGADLSRIVIVNGDVTDPSRMKQVVGTLRPDFVYHFAATSDAQPDIDVKGALYLLEALQFHGLSKTTKFFLAGSFAEYGAAPFEKAVPESAALAPTTPHGAAKVAAEMLARQFWLTYGQQVVVGRFFTQVGPGARDRSAVQQWCRLVALAERGLVEPVIPHGDLMATIDVTDVQDIAPIVVLALESGVPGEAYNLGSGVGTSLNEILKTLLLFSQIKMEVTVDLELLRTYERRPLEADISKLQELTGGNAPRFDAAFSVSRMLDHWRKQVGQMYPGLPKEEKEEETSSSGCPFDDIDILLVVPEHNFPLMPHLMASLAEFMPCYGTLNLITDTLEEQNKLRAWIPLPPPGVSGGVRFRLLDPPLILRHINSYIYGGVLANWADILVSESAKYVMMLDSDVVFTLPVTCNSLFDETGRVYMPYWDFSHQGQFKQPCDDHIGDCVGSFMAFFPMVFPVSMFRPMRDHTQRRLEASYNRTFEGYDEAWAHWSRTAPGGWNTYSQFANLGNYAHIHQQHLVHTIFYPVLNDLDDKADAEAIDYLAPALHYGWKYATPDNEHKHVHELHVDILSVVCV
jgi:GDP-4-dehydro-6-deoxy-D-mannose reductase